MPPKKKIKDTNNTSSVSNSNSQSQQSQNSSEDVSNLVQNCVRYFLIQMKNNIPVKRSEIVKQLFKEKQGRMFDSIINSVDDELQRTYGLKLVTIVDDKYNKKYVIVNNLEKPEIIENINNPQEDFKQMILFLVLTHIFMSKNSATDDSLWEFLKELDITRDREVSCFENVDLFITKQLVKQQYINIESTKVNESELRKRFSWGIRAERTVSKMKLLEFVGKIYGSNNVQAWTSRYEAAEKQFEDIN